MKELILNEKQLIDRCIDRDRHAEEQLFNHFYDELYALGMRYLSDHQNTEDAVIKAFTRVFRNLHKFNHQGQGSLGRWIRTILINESIRILKKKNQLHLSDEGFSESLQNNIPDALHNLQYAELIRVIERLPAGYRTVFNLFVVEGYPHKEIASLLGISENTSKSQLSKARNHLISQLTENESYGTI